MTNRISQVGGVLRQGARDLPETAVRWWKRTRVVAGSARSRVAARIAQRPLIGPKPVDADRMTKDELMELARKEDIQGRSSMTKAQLATALRRARKS